MVLKKKKRLGRPKKYAREFVDQVVYLVNEGYTIKSICARFNLSASTVCCDEEW